MKKCYLDSNFLIYLKDSFSIRHKEAVNKLNKLISENYLLYISPLVLDEFIYVLEYSLINKNISNPYQIIEKTVREIMKIPDLSIVNAPVDKNNQIKIIKFMKDYSLKPRDAYHLLIMISSDIDSFATFDDDFNKIFSEKILMKI